MKIDTVTTKVHTAVFSADDLKSVAISAVKSSLGLGDASTYEAPVATIGEDGSIKVEIVESVPAETAAAPSETEAAPAAEEPAAPVEAATSAAPVIPSVVV